MSKWNLRAHARQFWSFPLKCLFWYKHKWFEVNNLVFYALSTSTLYQGEWFKSIFLSFFLSFFLSSYCCFFVFVFLNYLHSLVGRYAAERRAIPAVYECLSQVEGFWCVTMEASSTLGGSLGRRNFKSSSSSSLDLVATFFFSPPSSCEATAIVLIILSLYEGSAVQTATTTIVSITAVWRLLTQMCRWSCPQWLPGACHSGLWWFSAGISTFQWTENC